MSQCGLNRLSVLAAASEYPPPPQIPNKPQPIKMLGAITGPVSMLLIGSFLLDIE